MAEWLDKIYIYAALAATDDLQQAQMLLRDQGIAVTCSRLAATRAQAAHCIRMVRDRGLPRRLYNSLPYDFYERLDKMARLIEDRLGTCDWTDRNDVDLLDKYLKLMQEMAQIRVSERPDGDEPTPPEPDLEEILKRFEQAKDRQQIKDAVRRVAAATGATFEPPGEPG